MKSALEDGILKTEMLEDNFLFYSSRQIAVGNTKNNKIFEKIFLTENCEYSVFQKLDTDIFMFVQTDQNLFVYQVFQDSCFELTKIQAKLSQISFSQVFIDDGICFFGLKIFEEFKIVVPLCSPLNKKIISKSPINFFHFEYLKNQRYLENFPSIIGLEALDLQTGSVEILSYNNENTSFSISSKNSNCYVFKQHGEPNSQVKNYFSFDENEMLIFFDENQENNCLISQKKIIHSSLSNLQKIETNKICKNIFCEIDPIEKISEIKYLVKKEEKNEKYLEQFFLIEKEQLFYKDEYKTNESSDFLLSSFDRTSLIYNHQNSTLKVIKFNANKRGAIISQRQPKTESQIFKIENIHNIKKIYWMNQNELFIQQENLIFEIKLGNQINQDIFSEIEKKTGEKVSHYCWLSEKKHILVVAFHKHNYIQVWDVERKGSFKPYFTNQKGSSVINKIEENEIVIEN